MTVRAVEIRVVTKTMHRFTTAPRPLIAIAPPLFKAPDTENARQRVTAGARISSFSFVMSASSILSHEALTAVSDG